MPRRPFVHLKVHSAYSLLEGALPIATLAKLADKRGIPALALTDTNNLFGALEFSDKLAGAGIQPIAGVSLAVDFGERRPGPDAHKQRRAAARAAASRRAHRALCHERGGLRQPDEARQPGASGIERHRGAARQARDLAATPTA